MVLHCSGRAVWLTAQPACSLAVAGEGAGIAALNLCSKEVLPKEHQEMGRIWAISFALFSLHWHQDRFEVYVQN